LAFFEDDSLEIQVSDWYDHVEDTDTPDSLLSWRLYSRNDRLYIQSDLSPYSFLIRADLDWWGVDTLTVIVSDEARRDSTRLPVHVLPVNDPPIAKVDSVNTVEDSDFIFSVLINDNDVDGDTLELVSISQPVFGTAVLTDIGSVYYQPPLNYSGIDTMKYVITDGYEAFDSANVYLTIFPVNDTPGFFEMISIDHDSTIQVTTDLLSDSLIFKWSRAIDIEGDSVSYNFEFTESLNLLEIADFSDTLYIVSIDTISKRIINSGATSISGNWDLFATDGLDTTWVDGGPFMLSIDISALEVLDLPGIPKEFALHPNYPNPFNPVCTIQFDLPIATYVQIVVYDILGRQIILLVKEWMEPGYQSAVWSGKDRNGRQIPSGVYIVRMITPDYTKSIKMVLLK
jgi:hypothetical protein